MVISIRFVIFLVGSAIAFSSAFVANKVQTQLPNNRPSPLFSMRKQQNGAEPTVSRAGEKINKKSYSFAYLEAKAKVEESRTESDILMWLKEENRKRNSLGFRSEEERLFLVEDLAHKNAYDAILFFVRFLSNQSQFTYSSAVSAIAQSKRHRSLAIKLLDEMEHRGIVPNKYTLTSIFSSIDGSKRTMQIIERIRTDYKHYNRKKLLKIEVYNAAIAACSRGRGGHRNQEDWQAALSLFLQLRKDGLKPSQATFAPLIRCCASAGQVRIALSLLEEMKLTMVPNERVWGAALFACSKSGDYQQAIKLLQNMIESGAEPNTLHINAMISALGREARVTQQNRESEGWRVMETLVDQIVFNATGIDLQLSTGEHLRLPNVTYDLVMVNTLLHTCGQLGNFKLAMEILQALKSGSLGRSHYDDDGSEHFIPFQPDHYSYNSVLSACDPKEAKALVKEMRDSRRHRHGAVPPTDVTYTLAITACRKGNPPRLRTALKLLDWARDDGLQLNVFIYSSAIWTAAVCSNPDVALHLFHEMKEDGIVPNLIVFAGLLNALASQGSAVKAVEIFQELRGTGLSPNHFIYQNLANAIRNSVNESEMEKIEMLEFIIKHFRSSDWYTRNGGPLIETLISLYGSLGRFEDALFVFGSIEGTMDGECLCAMLGACSTASPPRWEEALEILHASDILDDAKGPGMVYPRAIGFSVIACAKSNKWEEALNVLDLYITPPSESEDLENVVPVAALNSLISSCGRCGRPDMAVQLLNIMEQRFGVKPDSVSYRCAAIACNQAEHEKRRQRRLRTSSRTQENQDEESLSVIHWWEYSLSILRRMKEDELVPDAQTYSSVISACEAAGQWQRALGVLRDCITSSKGDNSRLNLFCFNAAISACEKGGAWVECLELYHRMMAQGHPRIRPNFVTINTILVALQRAGQIDLAVDTYNEAVQIRAVNSWRLTSKSSSEDYPTHHDNELDERRYKIRALDLHLNSAAMALTAVRSVMYSLRDEGVNSWVHDSNDELVIIVGKGLGSEGNAPVLRPLLTGLLLEEFGVEAQVDSHNAGRLVVSVDKLNAFIMKSSGQNHSDRSQDEA